MFIKKYRFPLIICSFIFISVIVFPPLLHANSIYFTQKLPLNVPEKTVALTFDDGPSPYSLQILNVLQSENIHATFFVVGNQINSYPHIVQNIYQQGSDIGNHTFTHPNLESLPNWQVREELNLNQLLISHNTGHETRIMRPPFLGSDTLNASSQKLINNIVRDGYIVVGEDVDTNDWKKPGINQIIADATTGQGGILLLHDGGGDRSQTVSALPSIIHYYKSHGYHFVTMSEYLGFSRSEIMPASYFPETTLAQLASFLFSALHLIISIAKFTVLILIIAGFGRLLLVISAAFIQSRRRITAPLNVHLGVSIIVPAYNEAAVIMHCLQSILKSHYTNFEILVVDDGSSDSTVATALQLTDPRIKIFTKENGGKASALNFGISLATHDFVIAVDADTVFQVNTLAFLMRHFTDNKVGAVSGNTKIANRHRLITKLQSLEYIVGFNLDRRMGDLFDCITVVPGAIGAFRKSVIEKIGGFASDTLAEDTDVTLSIKELGHTIIYDADAIAHTEAPSTIKDLLKQRFRWTFGTMQAVWKHKRSFLNPQKGTLGLIGLPYLVLYQIVFPIISPIFDLALIIGLFAHRYELIIVSLLVYTTADIMSCAFALWLDRESFSLLWLLIPQRLIYRQLMYYVLFKSLYYVLKGRLVGWGTLKREGAHLAKIT
ncbi:MAG: hypothetical protein NVSMB46_09480 [Candidatus Saccharimonadales bacterium]